MGGTCARSKVDAPVGWKCKSHENPEKLGCKKSGARSRSRSTSTGRKKSAARSPPATRKETAARPESAASSPHTGRTEATTQPETVARSPPAAHSTSTGRREATVPLETAARSEAKVRTSPSSRIEANPLFVKASYALKTLNALIAVGKEGPEPDNKTKVEFTKETNVAAQIAKQNKLLEKAKKNLAQDLVIAEAHIAKLQDLPFTAANAEKIQEWLSTAEMRIIQLRFDHKKIQEAKKIIRQLESHERDDFWGSIDMTEYYKKAEEQEKAQKRDRRPASRREVSADDKKELDDALAKLELAITESLDPEPTTEMLKKAADSAHKMSVEATEKYLADAKKLVSDAVETGRTWIARVRASELTDSNVDFYIAEAKKLADYLREHAHRIQSYKAALRVLHKESPEVEAVSKLKSLLAKNTEIAADLEGKDVEIEKGKSLVEMKDEESAAYYTNSGKLFDKLVLARKIVAAKPDKVATLLAAAPNLASEIESLRAAVARSGARLVALNKKLPEKGTNANLRKLQTMLTKNWDPEPTDVHISKFKDGATREGRPTLDESRSEVAALRDEATKVVEDWESRDPKEAELARFESSARDLMAKIRLAFAHVQNAKAILALSKVTSETREERLTRLARAIAADK